MPFRLLDEEPEKLETEITPQQTPKIGSFRLLEDEPALAQPSQPTYKYDPSRFRPKGLTATKEEREIGTLEGISNAAKNAFDSSRQAMDVVGGVTPEEAQNIAKIEFDKKSRKLAPGYDEYQKAEGMDAVWAFAKNPIEVTSNIIAEGLAGSLPALGAGLAAGGVGAAIGAPTGIGAPIGFTAGQVAGTFAGSLATEYGGKVLEELQGEGMDISDPNSIQTFFSNEDLLGKAKNKALKRGVPIAAFDAISAGIGGKLGRVFGTKAIEEGGKVIGKQFATKTGEAATELGVQAGLGGGGEVAGALAAGEPIEGKAVFGEVIGEVGPGSIEVLTGRIADQRAMAKSKEDAKIKATSELSTTLEENNAPLTASVVTAKSAVNIEQDKLAAQLEEELSIQQAAAAAQPTTTDATQKIIQPEGVRQEPQDGTQVKTEEASVSRGLLGATRSEEERQVARDIVSELQAVANNTATREQIARLSMDGLVDVRKGQAIINEDGEGILAQAQAPLPKLTPEERAAEVEVTPVTTTLAEPTIGEIPQTSPMIGEQPTQPIISEIPTTSELVGAEPATIVEQEQVAPKPLPQEPENYVTVFHATDTQPNIGQRSGYYKGTYTATSKELAKDFGKNLFSTQIDKSKIYKLSNANDSQQLKKDARNAGFNVSEGNGNGETEYLISKGYEGIQRGKEIIILSPQKYKFNSVAEVAPPTEPTIKESLPVAEAPAITPASVEEVEFAELNDLMDRRGQAQGKVKGVKFSKKDEARYNELLPKYRSRLFETITPESDPVIWKDLQGNDIKVSQKGTFYTVENGRVRTGPAFQSEGFIEDVSPQPISAAVVESNNIELPEGYTKQGDVYVYQAPVAETPAVTGAIVSPEQYVPSKNVRGGTTKQPLFTSLILQDGTAIVGESAHPLAWNRAIELGITTEDQLANSTSAFTRPDGFTETINGNQIPIKKIVWMDQFADIQTAASQNNPINAAAVDTYDITLPEGYTKQGNLYVYQPPVAETPAVAPAVEVAPAEEGQFSIYQMERKDGMRWLVQSGERRGFGDAIFNTKEDAEKYASDEKLRQQQRASMVEREAQIKRDEEAAKELREKNVNEFTTAIGATPIAAGKIKKTLMEKAAKRTGGKVYEGTRAEIVEQFVAIGFKPTIAQVDAVKDLTRAQFNRMDNRQQAEFEKKKKAAGKKNEYRLENAEGYLFDVTKAEYDYANWLESRTEIQPTPAVSETITPAAEVAPATTTRPAQEDVKVRRIRQFLGESAPQAISEAKNALARFKKSNYGKLGDNPFQAEPRLRELKNVISSFVGNRLSVTNQKADEIAEQIILGKPNIVDKVTELKPIKAKELDDIGAIRSSITRFGYEQDDKKTYRHPREAEVITVAPAAEPAGISVGNRIKLGKSPQTYIVEQVVPQSEVEKANNEQYYSVKNERTGEVQVVEKADMKQVGGSKPMKMAAEVIPNQEVVTPIPEANRYTFEEAVKAVDAHFGKQGIPEGVVIVNNTTDPDLEMKAGYFVNRGQIVINLAYIAKGENLGDIIDHELGHYIFGDSKFKELFKSFWESMTPEEKAEADTIINQFYNKETGAVQMEEKQIRAFMQLIKDSKAMPKWKQLLDSIKRWINEKFGTNLLVTDRNALAVLAAAHKRFKSGEQIVREIDSGVLKMAAEPRREQVAGKERGDIITTPEGIIKQTNEVLRKKFFDGSEVSDENTSAAWDYIEQLLDTESGAAYDLAGQINNVVDQETNSDTRMGAGLFSVSLANYAAKLAVQGNTTMISYLVRRINSMPTDNRGGTATESGRVLRGRREYSIDGYKTLETEHDSKVERTSAALFGTGRPSKEQVAAVEAAIKESEDTSIGEPEEVAAEIEKVEKRTKRNVVKKIEDQISGNIEEKRKAALEKQKARPATPSSVERQAISVIDQLARIQSDTPAFSEKQENLIKAIVQQDLRQKPDMKRKQPWTSQLTAKLIQAGASEAQAETISDLVWRQHEIKAMDRELKELQTAAEKGSLAVIIQRIKDTPLEEQQKPEWMQSVIREYLVEAGLSEKAAVTAARLYESVIAERFAEAKQKAFEDTLAKSAPWKNYLSRNAQLGKNALKKIQDAIRTGVLDPTQTTEGIIAKENGWSGFSKEQLTRIVQLDDILSNEENDQITKAEAMSELNKIIVKAKMPVRFRDAISAYYVAQALLGIPTFTVNIYSPTMFAIRNFAIDVAKYAATDPAMIPVAFQSFINSFQNLYDNAMYSFKNQIYMSGEIEYMQGQNVLSELFDKGKAQWAKGDYANGMGNMLVGASQITGRILSALDQGAIEMMQSQNITRYVIEAMSGNKKIPKDKRNEIVNIAISGRRKIKEDLIASGMAPERAGVLAGLKVRSELMISLSGFGIKERDVLDAALNDALQSVGRNRAITINSLKQEQNNLRDAGILSGIPIGFLEGVAQWANKGNQSQQVFAKMLYGFALVPARVFSTSLWFSPIGFVRLGVDSALKKKGMESRYAMSLATEFQQKQRFIEAIAGTIFWVGLGALISSSTDEEDEDKFFKIVVTGNGPDYNTDRQYHDSWHKKYKVHSTHIVIGKTIIPINIGRGGEAISIPLIFLGAGDDSKVKEKLNQARKSPADLETAAEMIGSVFYSFSNRGPFSAFTKPLFDAKKQDKLASELFSQAGYFGKTFIPIVGTSLARNISDFISDPIDKSSVQGAIYSNMPIVGPMIGTKALNAFGQPIRADDWGDRLFKLGAPLAMSFPKNTPENELNELVLKKGDGPPIPTRTNAQKKFEEPLTDKEFELYVREYGRVVSDKMFKNRKRLETMDVKNYTKELDKYVNGYSIDGIEVNGASDMAVRAVKRSRNE